MPKKSKTTKEVLQTFPFDLSSMIAEQSNKKTENVIGLVKGAVVTDPVTRKKAVLTKQSERKGTIDRPALPSGMYEFSDRDTAEKFYIKTKDVRGTTFSSRKNDPRSQTAETSDLTFRKKYKRVKGGFKEVI